MIVVVKIIGDADLRVGQVGKNGSLAEFKYLRFEPRPAAFGLRVVIAVAVPTLRAHRPVLVQEGAIGVATILPTAVGVDE